MPILKRIKGKLRFRRVPNKSIDIDEIIKFNEFKVSKNFDWFDGIEKIVRGRKRMVEKESGNNPSNSIKRE